jgi:hypothetical protein
MIGQQTASEPGASARPPSLNVITPPPWRFGVKNDRRRRMFVAPAVFASAGRGDSFFIAAKTASMASADKSNLTLITSCASARELLFEPVVLDGEFAETMRRSVCVVLFHDENPSKL